jgi:hypothetical protein
MSGFPCNTRFKPVMPTPRRIGVVSGRKRASDAVENDEGRGKPFSGILFRFYSQSYLFNYLNKSVLPQTTTSVAMLSQ